MSRIPILVLAVLTGCASTQQDDLFTVNESTDTAPLKPSGMSKERKALILNTAVAAGVIGYGLKFWDYGERQFQFREEGFFGKNTDYGGADKFGHMYSSYLTTLGFATLYEHWGYDGRDADLYGAMSSMGMFTLIEVGDGFSRNGFSYEDMIFDAAGVAFGFMRRRYPRLRELLDLRVEYWPSRLVTEGGRNDISTDYNGFRYMAALKLEGFRALEHTPLAYTDLLVGYYTRGYGPSAGPYYDTTNRAFFVGIGLNMSRILRKAGLEKTSKIFNFYQAPYTYVRFDNNLD